MDTVDQLIDLALREDIDPGDVTTDNLIDAGWRGSGEIIAKEPLVVAGLSVAKQVFRRLDPDCTVVLPVAEGTSVENSASIFQVKGLLRCLLQGERVALNFLQRLSGIATHVRSYASALKGTSARLVDTRKTTPGWRKLEKYAVRVGGGANHRMGLYDGVLIKDNHIAVCGGIESAVTRARRNIHQLLKIEVEVSGMDEVREALKAGADIIMLDNMNTDQIRAAKAVIGNQALVEVSGGVTDERLAELARTGVDLISVGALTHSARSVDMSMRISKDRTANHDPDSRYNTDP